MTILEAQGSRQALPIHLASTEHDSVVGVELIPHFSYTEDDDNYHLHEIDPFIIWLI